MVIPDPEPHEISLYFHIPFCKQKCAYCHFFVVKDQKTLHDDLMKGFLFEIAEAKPLLKNRTLKSVYFGGGTPSLLDPKNIAILLDKLDIPSDTEITMEFNPESTSRELFSLFKKAGINRASIGIQSFDNELLHTLTREHSAEKAKTAIYDAYNAGIENITIDLMYEIPGQTRNSWTKSLKIATTLPITHLSLYNLTFEEGTAFYRRRNALKLLLPSDDDAAQMLLEAIAALEAHGFSQYEISAFAKNNLYSVHNTGYWLGREFLGFGPSAFSYFAGKRFRNVENLKKYFEKCSDKCLPMDFEEELSPEGKIRELFTINLRLNSGVSLKEFQARHGRLPKELEKTLEELVQEGFVIVGERVSLTERGRLFFNEVAPRLI